MTMRAVAPTETIPVANMEVEQALLGAILINNDAYAMVAGIVTADDFLWREHQAIYQVLADLITRGKVATPTIAKTFLDPKEKYGDMTPARYLARLVAEATTVINARDYANTIRDLSDQRRIAEVAAQLRTEVPSNPVELAAWGIAELDAVVSHRTATGSPSVMLRDAVVAAVDAAASAYQRDGSITGISWGLADLDAKTLGAHRRELAIIAGRPGMGKTGTALCIARKMCEAHERGILFSLEMPDIPLAQRMQADAMFDGGAVPYWELMSGRFKESTFDRLRDVSLRLAELPLHIEQQANVTVGQIAARARQVKRQKGLSFVMVDHLQLVRASERYSGNRPLELGEVTAGLKALAKDEDLAVIALCQLSRQVEGREDKRPTLADLKWSGDIEQDADTVIMLFREAYYLERREPATGPGTPDWEAWRLKMEKAENRLEAIIEKQRNGPVGTVQLFFNIACNALRDLTRPEQQGHLEGF